MTVNSVRLHDFQKWEDLLVEFSPFVTTIIGENDAGKSAVLRAIAWAVFNSGSSRANVRRASKETEVRARLEVDRLDIVRRAGKRINQYRMEKRTYKAFGLGRVPEEVSKFLNLSEDNFQFQHDPPFWFSLSPGEVSKRINSIVNLQAIGRTMANITKAERKAKAELSVTKDRLRRARVESKGLRWVVGFARQIKAIQKQAQTLARLRKKAHRISELASGASKAQTRTQHRPIKPIQKYIRGIEKLCQRRRKLQHQMERLLRLTSELHLQERRRKKSSTALKKANAKLSRVKKCPVCLRPLS